MRHCARCFSFRNPPSIPFKQLIGDLAEGWNGGFSNPAQLAFVDRIDPFPHQGARRRRSVSRLGQGEYRCRPQAHIPLSAFKSEPKDPFSGTLRGYNKV